MGTISHNPVVEDPVVLVEPGAGADTEEVEVVEEAVECFDGLVVGAAVGLEVGADVGAWVAPWVGACVGADVGLEVGLDVGLDVGLEVGAEVATPEEEEEEVCLEHGFTVGGLSDDDESSELSDEPS